MVLSELNTASFFFDPKSKTFLSDLEKHDEFGFTPKDYISKKDLCTYIALCYDPESDIRKTYSHYGTRKRMAAVASGFELDEKGKFSQDVEDYLVGENMAFNAAIVKYLSFTYDLNFMRYYVFELLQHKALLAAMNGDTKGIEQADKLTEKQSKEGVVIFGGNEVHEMRRALSEGAAIKALELTPEDIAYKLADGENLNDINPYGDYEVDKLKFIGDDIPES